MGLLFSSMKNPLYRVEIIFLRKEFDEIWRLIKKLKRKDCAAAVSKGSRCYRAVRRAGWLKKSLAALFGLYKSARLGYFSPFELHVSPSRLQQPEQQLSSRPPQQQQLRRDLETPSWRTICPRFCTTKLCTKEPPAVSLSLSRSPALWSFFPPFWCTTVFINKHTRLRQRQ